MITIVNVNNQVTIPADLAYAMNIRAGTRLEWTKDDKGMLLAKPLPSRGESADRLQGAGRRWLKPGDDPIAKLIEDRIREDENI